MKRNVCSRTICPTEIIVIKSMKSRKRTKVEQRRVAKAKKAAPAMKKIRIKITITIISKSMTNMKKTREDKENIARILFD
jgi:hypothetical protein